MLTTVMCLIMTSISALTQSDVREATGRILAAAGTRGTPEFLQFASSVVQLWFHDTSTFRALPNGGPNGCIDRTAADNSRFILNAYDRLITVSQIEMNNRISVADTIVLAASAFIMTMIPPSTTAGMDLLRDFQSGRVDQVPCAEKTSQLPVPTEGISAQQRLRVRLGITMEEMVALMGAHSLGGAQVANNTRRYFFDETPDLFDNNYYTTLLSKPWQKGRVPFGPIWANGNNVRFESDIACNFNTDASQCRNTQSQVTQGQTTMIRRKRNAIPTTTPSCPVQPQGSSAHVSRFASDTVAWHQAFSRAFLKVSSNGYNSLTSYANLAP